jgi:CubicO group peptidase (beta-lactamase class C family)
MSSGQVPYDGPYDDLDAYAKTVLTVGVEAPPETVWAYSSASVDQLSHIIENITGVTLREFFHREISTPIGVMPFAWGDFQGHTRGSGTARATPRDLARIGYLMLRKGAWDNGHGSKQVLSEEWVSMITQWAPFLKRTKYREPNFAREKQAQNVYGYLWWTNRGRQTLGEAVPADVYYMSGFGKQAVWIFPGLDMIVVRLGLNQPLNDRPEFYRELLSRVMTSVESAGSSK